MTSLSAERLVPAAIQRKAGCDLAHKARGQAWAGAKDARKQKALTFGSYSPRPPWAADSGFC